jgi:hypothetical protein
MRGINRRVVLETIHQYGPIARTRIAEELQVSVSLWVKLIARPATRLSDYQAIRL